MKYILSPLYNLWKIYIGCVFIVTLLLFYPVLYIFIHFETLKQYSFKINIFWSRCVSILCFYAVEKSGKTPHSKMPFIIIANHTSYLDIFLLYRILPKNKFIFMGKSELLKYPLVKTYFKKLNIPVDRRSTIKSAKAFIQARKALKKDWCIAVFPEGGIFDSTPQMSPFKNGAFQLAKSAQSAILPITFKNNYRLFSDPSYFLSSAMPGLVKVHIHQLISKEKVEGSEINDLKNKTYHSIASFLPKKND